MQRAVCRLPCAVLSFVVPFCRSRPICFTFVRLISERFQFPSQPFPVTLPASPLDVVGVLLVVAVRPSTVVYPGFYLLCDALTFTS